MTLYHLSSSPRALAAQQVLQSLELAASVVQELAHLSSSDPRKAEAQTIQFLETVKVGALTNAPVQFSEAGQKLRICMRFRTSAHLHSSHPLCKG